MNGAVRWFLAPARVWMTAFFAAPLGIVLVYAFLTRGEYGGVEQPWTLENFSRLADVLYLRVALRSVVIAAIATGLCIALGFPLALAIVRAGRWRNLLLQMVLLPFWTSFLIRTYAWLFILRDTGLVNTALEHLHLIHGPLPLLYNDFAVVLGLVYNYLPFLVIPVYASIERMDPALEEAAADLGARPWTVVRRVVWPLAMPGVVAGGLLIFIPCLGAYLTPDLLGGGKSVMLGNVVQNQFTTARDWPFGSAISIVLLGICSFGLARVLRNRAAGELL